MDSTDWVAALALIFAVGILLDRRAVVAWNRFAATLPMAGKSTSPPQLSFDHVDVEFYPKGPLSPWLGGSRLFAVVICTNGLALRCEQFRKYESCFVPWELIRDFKPCKFANSVERNAEGMRIQLDTDRYRLTIGDPAGTAVRDHWCTWRSEPERSLRQV